MSTQTSDNNKRIVMNTMIYDKIINKLNGIQEKFAYNIKNILLNGIASSVFLPPPDRPKTSVFDFSTFSL